MRNFILLFTISSFFFTSITGQVIEKRVFHPLDYLTYNSRIINVAHDSVNEQTIVDIEKSVSEHNVTIRSCVFDRDLNFLTDSEWTYQIEEYDLFMEILSGNARRIYGTSLAIVNSVEGVLKTVDEMKGRFESQGKSYTIVVKDIRQKLNGKFIMYRERRTFVFNAILNDYILVKSETLDEIEIAGINGEKYVIFNSFVNSQTDETILLVGEKAKKGDKIKLQEARHFRLIRINKDFTIDEILKIDFDYNMGISFRKTLLNSERMMRSKLKGDDIYDSRVLLIFSPIHLSRDKTHSNPKPGNGHIIIFDDNGNVLNNSKVSFPISGWVIEDVIKSPNDNGIILYGPAQKDKYIDQVKQLNLPFYYSQMIPQNINWKHFQIMKISSNEVLWVNDVSVDEVNALMQTTEIGKGKIKYSGKQFLKRQLLITANGELLICGQNTGNKSITDSKEIGTGVRYGELILFHFENTGELKATYGIKKKETNKYSKSFATTQTFYVGPNNNSLLWIYGEIQGKNMDHLMVAPVVTEIDLKRSKMNSLLPFEPNKRGKQDYFTSMYLPHVLIAKENSMIVVARDKKFNNLSLVKISSEQND